MSMVCPQCKNHFEQNLDCPTCGVRLVYHLGGFAQDNGSSIGRDDSLEPTAWSRLAAGLMVAQGLAYGSQHLFTAWFLVSDQTAGSSIVWATLWGLVLLHVLQGTSLLIGAALTGAGQRQGMLFGGLIGLVHGLIFLLVQQHKHEALSLVAACGQPILFAAIGTLGGRLGMLIWTPTPLLPTQVNDNTPRIAWNALSFLQYFDGPVSIGRVVIGILIVVIGVVWSNLILSIIINASGGTLVLATHLQDRLLLFEISALATLAGSGLAGATTWNGLKQGLCVGIGASVILVGIQLGSPAAAVLETTLFTVISTMFLSLAGGWFGGQLFPPILQRRRRGGDIFSHRY